MTMPNNPMTCVELDEYLAEMMDGELEPERAERLAAHLETCPACRHEVEAWREQEGQLHRYFALEREKMVQRMQEEKKSAVPAAKAPKSRRLTWRQAAWAAAALLFVALGVETWRVYQNNVPVGDRVLATVKTIKGRVQLLQGGTFVALEAGAPLRQGQRIKIGDGGYAALEYPNGNILEAREGTQLALKEFADRTEVALNRGQVWAHLKTHPKKKYFITTSRLKAIATGTVYSVQDGVGQTLVAVAEGTVRIEGAGVTPSRVSAGGIYTSRPDGDASSVSDLTAWSRYRQDLAALDPDAGQDAKATVASTAPLTNGSPAEAASPTVSVAKPGLAVSSTPSKLGDLVDALPAQTRAFIEIRDWPKLRGQFGGSAYGALTREPSLRQWWGSINGSQYLQEFVSEIRLLELLEIVNALDGQVVAAITPDQGDILLLADCRGHEEAVSARIQQLMTAKPDPQAQPGAVLQNMEDLRKLRDHVVIAGGRLIVSSSPEVARAAVEAVTQGKATGFKSSPFYRKIAANSKNPLLAAAINMKGILPEGKDKDFDNMVSLLGLRGLDYLLIAPSFQGQGLNQAARLGFSGKRYGVMNWLAEPGPMRGYDFFSSDVHLFMAARVRSARQIYFDWLLHRGGGRTGKEMDEAQRFFDQHQALFDSIGGEIAIGIDNPVLPMPNVKIAVELADRKAFQAELEGLVGELTARMKAQGKYVYRQANEYKGTTVYSLALGDLPMIVPSWAFIDDYLVIGPGPQFVQHSIDVYTSGQSIGNDSHLTSLFPSGAGTHFSLLFYQDVVKALPDLMKNKVMPVTDADAAKFVPDLSFLSRYKAPGIAFANANADSVDIFMNTPSGIDFNMGMAVPIVANWLAPHLNVGLTADKYAEAVVDLQTMGQLAEQYKTAHGRYPKTLGELKSEGEIPKDPFAVTPGDTLRLAPAADGKGVILYSIGPDGIDQQGKEELGMDEKLDTPGDIVIHVPENLD